MTPRAYLLTASPDAPAALGLRALAAVCASADARGPVSIVRGGDLVRVLPSPLADVEYTTDGEALAALPYVLRDVLDGLAALGADASAADRGSGHRDRDPAHLSRATRDTLRSLAYELHAAARVARIPIAPPPPKEPQP
jgi:hypothetical protein